MTEKTDSEKGAERREYFRIDDDVHLTFRTLTETDYRRALESPEAEGAEPCNLVAQLHSLSSQAGHILSSIRKSDPEIAQYLALMDKKLDLVAGIAEGTRYEDQAPNARVNIGAGGLAFPHSEALPLDTKLEVKVLLFPSYLCVSALGRVVHCEGTEEREKPYRIGLEFTRIAQGEQDALIKHVLELQSALLRRQRGEE